MIVLTLTRLVRLTPTVVAVFEGGMASGVAINIACNLRIRLNFVDSQSGPICSAARFSELHLVLTWLLHNIIPIIRLAAIHGALSLFLDGLVGLRVHATKIIILLDTIKLVTLIINLLSRYHIATNLPLPILLLALHGFILVFFATLTHFVGV